MTIPSSSAIRRGSMNAPTTRVAAPDDLPALEALLTTSSLPIVGVAESLRGFLVAESGTGIVGVIGLEDCGDYALLRSAVVAADWRGRGIARELVAQSIARARAEGVLALYLLTTTAESYFPAFGFTVVTRDAVPDAIRATAEFQGACPASATVMRLDLQA